MIELAGVCVRYDDAPADTLHEVDLRIGEGEFVLVAGPTGSGKSTLLGLLNGHVPHFTGGTVTGSVLIGGRSTRTHRPRDLAELVGVVGQDPARGFVTDRVTDELVYTMESLALPPAAMRRRLADILDLLGLAGLRDRRLATLSGGQQQRVAIGAALTAHPRVLVLDEPTSALDPASAEGVLSVLSRLVHDLAITVVLAEHRLERVIGEVDAMVLVHGDGRVGSGSPAQVMRDAPVFPPVVELGRWAGWDPLPLTVREARRRSAPLRAALPAVAPDRPAGGEPLLVATDLVGGYHRDEPVLGPVTLSLAAGESVALMGRNGAGKSTLLWTAAGAMERIAGSVRVTGADPAGLDADRRRRSVTLVPQQPSDLLYRTSVGAELAQADRDCDAPAGTTAATLDRLEPGIDPAAHPRDLSEGQRLALVLAIQLTAAAPVLLLDEPTRGLDYAAKHRLTALLAELTAAGRAVLIASHDVEFVAGCCRRVLILADGQVVDDGPAATVLTASPTYAPQVAKVVAPATILSVAEVAALLPEGIS